MKIIRAGKLKAAKKMKGECILCNCVVQVAQSEARYVEDRPGDGAYCVTCPTCKQEFLWVT